ncbi:putative tripeptidyl-peptidase II [Helianthus annuus]|nr:putative tripeptidyl-peptidase II [Helianthus annuus]
MFTTRTPRFLGLNRGSCIWPTKSYGKDMIIGVTDTGIWPESESFNEKGMFEEPSRWKGIAPRAHLAMHKVQWPSDTEVSATTDVLVDMDQAISESI